jgi:hypothetical protein
MADSTQLLCETAQYLLPTIDTVLDTLEMLEYIITTNDPIITPKSTTTVFQNSLQSMIDDFGPERPKFANRLPLVMAYGLAILTALMQRLALGRESLYSMQEDRLGSFAQHLLTTYTSIIKRPVIQYCTALHKVIKPEKKFYSFFTNESDQNLIHYYVAGAASTVYGSLGDSDKVVMPDNDFDSMESLQPQFNPASYEADWDVLVTQ